jgi:TetR/AcrR family transcriptional regulator, cholesterol catabolism regulator
MARARGRRTGNDARARRPRMQPGHKRQQILEVATDHFGRKGYERTKWADVAADVGFGSSAIYHYFESKQHCLYELMGQALANFQERFDRNVAAHDDWSEALVAVLVDLFDLTESEVLRIRVLVAKQGLVAIPRALPREEAARVRALDSTYGLEFAWRAFLARGMRTGAIPDGDPKLLARAVLGLYNSIFHWFRPGGTASLDDLRRFFVDRELAALGCAAELSSLAFPSEP